MALSYFFTAFSKRQVNQIIKAKNANKTLFRNISNSKPQIKKPSGSNKLLVDGFNLHWKKFGDGPHVALCLPGLVGSIDDNYLPVAKKMNLEKFTLISWDPPGYGKSRPPDREVFTQEFVLAKDARLVNSLMQQLGYEKFSTIGWSNGGITGALLAAMFPEKVHKVVLCNAPLEINHHTRKVMEVMVDLDSWVPTQRKTLLRTYDRKYAEKMLHDWKKIHQQNAGNKTFAAYLSGEMKKVVAPTLFIKSLEDVIIPLKDAENYGNLIQDYRLHKVPKGGHNHLEFVDDFVAATERFLSE